MDELSENTKELLETIRKFQPVRSSELAKIQGVSNKTVYKHLGRLTDEGLICKVGETPKVFYSVKNKSSQKLVPVDTNDLIIEQNYIYVSPSGDLIRGLDGFVTWCEKNEFDLSKEKKLYLTDVKKMSKYKVNGLISAKRKILSGKKTGVFLDELFHSDFYNLTHFGKTKLGQLVYIGKSSQNKEIIAEIAMIIKPQIDYLIEKYEIKNICFIPPTIDRKVQFLDFLKKKLNIDLSEVKVSKVSSQIKIAQKTLRKLENRILNAEKNIVVNPTQEIIGNVLIIDDATGSGATLNETAKKIRNIATNKTQIIGYSVVGSYKGFDVISEV